MIKRWIALTAAVLLLSGTALGLRLRLEQARLASGLIRLHVVASSDDPADQERKLLVRDALLPVIETETRNCGTAAEAKVRLQASLPRLQRTAESALRAAGSEELVTVSLGKEPFPTRVYDSFALPAGRYTALRVTIGAGAGHNWWCVAFPALCLPACAEGFEETAEAAGLDPDQIDLMRGEGKTVRLKFRLLDLLETVFD